MASIYKDKTNVIPRGFIDKYVMKNPKAGVVFRLSYAGKYIIAKGKTLSGALFLIDKGYGWYNHMNVKDDTLYKYFYYHIKRNPGKRFSCKVLLRSNNHYALLKREHDELLSCMKDKNCLNNNVQSYIPSRNEDTGDYGWIPKAAVLNYLKYVKSLKFKEKMLKSNVID